MQIPPEISYRHFQPSDAVRARVDREIAHLEKFYPAIISCQVVLTEASGHKRHGGLPNISIQLAMPGGRHVSVTHKQDDAGAHADLLVAIRDAFSAAVRQLEDQARKQRLDVKRHVIPAQGVIARFLAESDAGFITSDDGPDIYFHANSLKNAKFDQLRIQDEVTFDVEEGEEGPQAINIRVKAAGRRATK